MRRRKYQGVFSNSMHSASATQGKPVLSGVGGGLLCAAVVLVALTGSAGAQPIDDPAGLLRDAREVTISRLTTRFAWPGEWRPDSPSAWTRRAQLAEVHLPKRAIMRMADALQDSCLRPLEPPRNAYLGPEDCDLLLSVGGRESRTMILLSFPELECRWIGRDSSFHVASWRGRAGDVIRIVKACFVQDSTVQDLPAALGWLLQNPKITGEGDGQIPWYEGIPEVLKKAWCEYPHDWLPDLQATALVEVLLDRRGLVRYARVKEGTPMLRGASVACVRRWTFRPAVYEGRPIGFRVSVPVKWGAK